MEAPLPLINNILHLYVITLMLIKFNYFPLGVFDVIDYGGNLSNTQNTIVRYFNGREDY